jgi:maltose O-acetyltransferase
LGEACPIEIGGNAWLGGVIACPAVIIGNADIGAGGVVVRDIPDCLFAAGNAARVIRRL